MHLTHPGRYLQADMRLLPEFYQVPLQFPSNFVQIAFSKQVIPPQRFLVAVEQLAGGDAMHRLTRALYQEMFATSEELAPLDTPERLTQVARKAGLEQKLVDEALQAMDGDAVKATLRANCDELLGQGGFGTPSCLVEPAGGEKVMVFGSDRLELIAHLLGEPYAGVNPK